MKTSIVIATNPFKRSLKKKVDVWTLWTIEFNNYNKLWVIVSKIHPLENQRSTNSINKYSLYYFKNTLNTWKNLTNRRRWIKSWIFSCPLLGRVWGSCRSNHLIAHRTCIMKVRISRLASWAVGILYLRIRSKNFKQLI